jgi:hypothetical protein
MEKSSADAALAPVVAPGSSVQRQPNGKVINAGFMEAEEWGQRPRKDSSGVPLRKRSMDKKVEPVENVLNSKCD